MILNDATVTYIDGEEDKVDEIKYMDFSEDILTFNCTHGVNVEIPMENIDTITIERRWMDARAEDEA